MLESDDLSRQFATFYEQRFGVPSALLLSLRLEANKEEVWGTTGAPLPGIHSIRAMGLRIGRVFPDGIKPTSVFLRALGDHVTRSRIPVLSQDLHRLLLGQRIPFDTAESAGYVAIEYQGDVLGCGRIHHNRLQALMPTGRRKELLEILFPHG